jgi:uncharacterized membrane protein
VTSDGSSERETDRSPTPPQAARDERERDLDRFLTFVDAIVAIAITLLVLPLAELATELDDYDTVGDLLRDRVDLLWSFALSFYVIMRLWLSQHHAVTPLLIGNRRLTNLLIAWTFTIVLLPFPTSLVASEAGDEPLTKILYVGVMAISVAVVGAVRAEIKAHPELTDGSAYLGPLGGITTAALMVVALVLMLLFPDLSYFPMLVLGLDGLLLRVLGNRGH